MAHTEVTHTEVAHTEVAAAASENGIDALILDIDGTLWDSTGIVSVAWERAAEETGFSGMKIPPETLKGLFGKTMDDIACALVPDADPEKRKELIGRCVEYEQEALENDPCHICYPGVIDTIRELGRRMKIAIVSNCQSGYIELFMAKTGLTDMEICDKECFGDTGKGKAENIASVVARNGFSHALYVGDTEGDRIAAYEAGTGFIAADYGFGEPGASDYRIDSFDRLCDLF